MPAPAAIKEERPIYGFLKQFDLGIDSNKAPLLLPSNQLAFGSNVTMRGDFVSTRPNYAVQTLVDKTGGTTLAAFQTGLFQGGCYFLTADGNLMLAVNGQLFQLSASGGSTLVVSKVALPDAGNWTAAAQNWLWQAERWLIWNDGHTLPLFYDGTTAKRSIGPKVPGQQLTSIGATVNELEVPPIGQSLVAQVSLTGTLAQQQAQVGLSFLLGAFQFTLQAVTPPSTAGAVTLSTDVLQQTAGDYLLCMASGVSFTGAAINTNTAYAGTLSAVVQNGVPITDWGSILAPTANGTITIGIDPSELVVDPTIATATNTKLQIVSPGTGKYQCWAVKVGDPVMLDGNACVVTALTYDSNTSHLAQITSITVQPTGNYTGPINTPSTFTIQNSYSLKLRFFNGANLYTETVTTLTGTQIIPPQGSPLHTAVPNYSILATSSTVFTWDSLSNQNTFTVSLNVQPAGLNPNTLYTFQAFPSSGSASATGVFFTGYWGGSSNALSMVNCTMTSAQIPPALNLVNLVSGFATAVSQYLVVTQAAGVAFVGAVKTVATVDNSTTSSTGVVSYANLAVPTAGNSLAIPAILAQGANIVAGTLLFAAAVTSGGVATGTTDAFVATGSSLGTSSSGTYAVFVNQSGTAGATVPALTKILPLPELPISTIGVYGQGRNWVALPDGVSFLGGDLVGGASGTKPYDYTDAVLYVSQNNFLAGGTTFKIPNSGEKIAAMQFVACLDASLGQGPLQVFTNETVFSVNTPPDATTWASLTNPILTESLIGSGGVGDDAVLQDNADLIFRTPDTGVQSMLLARLDFNRWGNSPISNEIYRIIQNDNPALLPFCSLVTFQNRRLMTAQPTQAARGVYHPALAVMNLDPLSSLQHKTPAIWEGQWTGLNVLKLITGTFASVKRCFAICLDATLTQIQVVEILADNPATQDLLPVGGVPTLQNVFSSIESPMIFERDQTNRFKRLANGEIYLDQITPAGVQVAAFWNVDESSAWTPWYTTTVEFQANDPGYRRPVGLGRPPGNVYDPVNNRPLREGYDFQVRFDFTGNCRFLGGRFAAELIDQPEFAPPKDSV